MIILYLYLIIPVFFSVYFVGRELWTILMSKIFKEYRPNNLDMTLVLCGIMMFPLVNILLFIYILHESVFDEN